MSQKCLQSTIQLISSLYHGSSIYRLLDLEINFHLELKQTFASVSEAYEIYHLYNSFISTRREDRSLDLIRSHHDIPSSVPAWQERHHNVQLRILLQTHH